MRGDRERASKLARTISIAAELAERVERRREARKVGRRLVDDDDPAIVKRSRKVGTFHRAGIASGKRSLDDEQDSPAARIGPDRCASIANPDDTCGKGIDYCRGQASIRSAAASHAGKCNNSDQQRAAHRRRYPARYL